MKKYFIYARKSSESEDRQVLSIESQVDELKNLSGRLKLHVLDVYSESKSAKAPGRSKFSEMVDRIHGGEAQGVICWKLDRLARNPVDGGLIIWAIKQSDIEIITPSQTYNQSSENTFMMYVEFGIAQKFIDDLSKNVKRGLLAKAKRGWFPNGAKPGYKNIGAEKGNKKIANDPKRFPLIKKAWELMLTGNHSASQILHKLNNEWGYRTPKHKRIGGKMMARSAIYSVFNAPFYYGKYEYPKGSGTWHKGKHEPMITKEEFNRVQSLLGKKGRPRPQKHNFPFTGLMWCGECGARITAHEKWQIICSSCKSKFASRNTDTCPKCNTLIEEMANPTRLHYIYYHCTKRKNPECTQGVIGKKDLEEQIDKVLSEVQISERFKNWAIKYLGKLHKSEVEDRSHINKNLQDTYSETQKKLDNLLDLRIRELISDEEYEIKKAVLLK
ncbi:MAG TPA: recombinase family protein, partial [bacterium]|nr:recombinase family protein [bacterium]